MKNEVEILLQVFDQKEKVFEALKKSGCTVVGTKKVDDYYFVDLLRNDLKPNAKGRLERCFRLRKKGDVAYLTYKKDQFDNFGVWSHSEETETEVGDFDKMFSILQKLGFESLVTIKNTKHIFEDASYEIVFEEVVGLGNFLEVEVLMHDGSDISETKQKIRGFLTSLKLNLGEELNAGKPELLLSKERAEKKD